MTSLSMRPFTPQDVAGILGSVPRPEQWVLDYPSEADLEVAGLLKSGTFTFPTAAAPWGPWVVEIEGGVAVGGCGFHGGPKDGVAEIGYNIVPSHQGRGLATAVVAMLLTVARDEGLREVVAGTDPENLPSQRVLERNGFAQGTPVDGELRWSRMLDGEDA